MTDKPTKTKAYSKYAQKRNQPIEWTHARHNPPVAGCGKCERR